MNVKLSCPKCGQHYEVDINPALIYEDMTCQTCGARIPVSAAPPKETPASPQKMNRDARQGKDAFPTVSLPASVMEDMEKAAAEKNAVHVRCPKCKNVFIPPHDPEKFCGGCECPACGFWLPTPLKQHVAKPEDPPKDGTEREPEQQAAYESADNNATASFFYVLSTISFLIGQCIVLFSDCSPVVSIDFGVSAIIFLLSAIYFKLPRQPQQK